MRRFRRRFCRAPKTTRGCFGAYHSYGTGKGDRRNGLIDTNIFAHPSVMKDAELKLDGTLDNRAVQKVFLKAEPAQGPGPRVAVRASRCIRTRRIRARRCRSFATKNSGCSARKLPSRATTRRPAAADINFIRVHSGGLQARNDLTMDNVVTELLKQRRYSLLFEAGHRWIDARRFDRLAELPVDMPNHKVHRSFPIPIQEVDPR